jgi:chemotaxis protein MotA
MFVIIGIVVVIGAIVGGYLMEHGNLKVLIQPAELVIIGGAAIGTVLIANPLFILKKIAGGLAGALGGSPFTKEKYLETLKMLSELLSRARKEGLMALEADSDAPDKSPVFSKYPKFLKDHHALHFVCDTLRMAAMGALGGPPEEIGHKVAAALVGTFLGILLCYGFIGPVASSMAKTTEDEQAYYYVLRVVLVSFIKGAPPTVAVEFGRRAIPVHVRPTFQEAEGAIKNKGGEAPAQAAA